MLLNAPERSYGVLAGLASYLQLSRIPKFRNLCTNCDLDISQSILKGIGTKEHPFSNLEEID